MHHAHAVLKCCESFNTILFTSSLPALLVHQNPENAIFSFIKGSEGTHLRDACFLRYTDSSAEIRDATMTCLDCYPARQYTLLYRKVLYCTTLCCTVLRRTLF